MFNLEALHSKPLLDHYLLQLFFCSEVRGRIILQKLGEFLLDYTASHSIRYTLHGHYCENYRSIILLSYVSNCNSKLVWQLCWYYCCQEMKSYAIIVVLVAW
jgi:hypothetical protein